jgi:hypothetical protein
MASRRCRGGIVAAVIAARRRRLTATLRCRGGIVAAAIAGAVLAVAAPARADMYTDVRDVGLPAAERWAAAQLADGTFPNPVAAEVARGYGGFGPPMLLYSLYRAGQRDGRPELAAAADRGWPVAVRPERANAFDMLAATYSLRRLSLPADTRRFLEEYIRRYAKPIPGRCWGGPKCYGNLKLVYAAAVLSMTSSGVTSPYPGTHLADPVGSRRAAAYIVNKTVPKVMRPLNARIAGRAVAGSVLSDPNDNPLAYHALSTFMLLLAVEDLGSQASAAARLAVKQSLEALSVLMSPDGDVSYVGRGQDQVWVPAVTAAALIKGARITAGADPLRAGRYLTGASQALSRLSRLHVAPYGFRVVPGTRTTMAGVDWYVNTLAYNGLTLFALQEAADAAAGLPALPVVPAPAVGPLQVTDREGSGLGVLANGDHWIAVNARGRHRSDLRSDFGLAGLQVRLADGTWRSLLAPRPLTGFRRGSSAGPTVRRSGKVGLPQGRRLRVTANAVRVGGGYKHPRPFTWWRTRANAVYRAIPGGVRVTIGGLRRREEYRFLVFTPPGTGALVDPRTLRTAYGTWRFDRRVRITRLPSAFHSGPVENLEAFRIRIPARHRRRLALTITLQ